MPITTANAVEKAAKMLGCSTDDVTAKMEKMEISDLLNLLDAVASNNVEEVKAMLDPATEEQQGEAENDEFEINPLFQKNSAAPKKKVEDENIEEEDHDPAMGDEVRVDGEDAIVKIVNGPRDTVGVQMDGQTAMVNKDQVKRVKKIDEAMSMGDLPGLRRMQELAGMQPSVEVARDEAPLAAGRVGVPVDEPANDEPAAETDGGDFGIDYLTPQRIAALAGAMPEVGGEPECPMAQALDQGSVEIEVEPAGDLSVCDGDDSVMDPGSVDGVMKAFDDIEAMLPNVRLGDAKEIRARINDIMVKMNEGSEGRRRKF